MKPSHLHFWEPVCWMLAIADAPLETCFQAPLSVATDHRPTLPAGLGMAFGHVRKASQQWRKKTISISGLLQEFNEGIEGQLSIFADFGQNIIHEACLVLVHAV